MPRRIEGEPFKIGIAGAGHVGEKVIEGIERLGPHRGYKLGRVAVRHPERYDHINAEFTTNLKDILKDRSIDIFLDLTADPQAAEWMADAMSSGMGVGSANKKAIAGSELVNESIIRQADLRFEAAVGGGTMLIDPTERRLRVDNALGTRQVNNGTTTFVFGGMSKGREFDDVLEDAIDKGLAERNHEADTQGYDSSSKLAIFASIILGKIVPPDVITRRGITGITPFDLEFAREYLKQEGGPGYAVRLLSTLKRRADGLYEARVSPALVPLDQIFAQVDGPNNVFEIDWENTGRQLIYGPGAGGRATAMAVLDDVDTIAQNRRHGTITEHREQEKVNPALFIALGATDIRRHVDIQRLDGTLISLPIEESSVLPAAA